MMPRPRPTLRTLLALELALIIAIGSWADAGGSQQDQPQYDVDVDLVRLHVAVINPSGGEVPPLTAEDFKVYDNEVLQQIQFMLQPSDLPLNVALVIDYSPSVQPYQQSLQRAAIGFLGGLSDLDCPFVLPFSEQIGPGQWGRFDPGYWSLFFQVQDGGYGTSLFDALLIALAQLDLADELAAAHVADMAGEEEAGLGAEGEAEARAKEEAIVSAEGEASTEPRHELLVNPPAELTRELLIAQIALIIEEIMKNNPPTQLGNCSPAQRMDEGTGGPLEAFSNKAILLLSDGNDTTSAASLEDMLIAARLATVPVFPVVLGPARRDAQLMARLKTLARATGGLMVESDDAAGLPAAFRKARAYAKSFYILAYDPDATSLGEDPSGQVEDQQGDQRAREGSTGPTLGLWHNVRVELRRPLLDVIVRPGYYR